MNRPVTEGRQTDPQSIHKYLYCQADPVNNADPTGCDIGETLSVEGITGRLMAMAAPATAKAGVAGGVWGTPGPDVTMAVMNTTLDVERAFMPPSRASAVAAAAASRVWTPEMAYRGWDVGPLNELGQQGRPDFGNGSRLGTGSGRYTVQFAYGFGQTPKVYYASSVNYFLWGKMFRMLYEVLRNPVSGAQDPEFSEGAAVAAAGARKSYLSVFGSTTADYNREATAFVRFGWNGTDPSSTALPIPANPSNIGASARFPWKWIGLHDSLQ